ncbi:IclR family transcriptional regulator C-terminal domain-containing protein [Clostridium sp.]|uniref:IclR family transcriptional regulator n=1 Tax=Clostridium sp. TaxID=1506 RepID=UPI00261AB1CE|nr:IclR family transcriptional regulator C-terminal domain-containing protein [Clostridium sp.]
MSSIKCLERALDILELMYENSGKMSLTEISKELNLYKSTVHRTLITLLEKDFIQKDEYTGYYTLGSRVFMLGMVAAKSVPIGKIARPHLAFLSEKYEERIDLSVLDSGITSSSSGKEFVVVFEQYINETYSKTLVTSNQCESSEEFLPAVYMIFVSYSKDLKKEDMIKHLDKINCRSLRKKWSYEELVKECEIIKERGYSYLNSDVKHNYMCIAAPIFDENNNLIAVISVRGTRCKFLKGSIEEVIKDVTNTANVISNQCNKLL